MRTRDQRARRSGLRSRATSAGAPAIRRLSRRCWRPASGSRQGRTTRESRQEKDSAVHLGAKRWRVKMVDTVVVGQRVKRVDALDKVTGRAKYTADLKLPGMLYGAFLRSPHAHARIKRIDTSKAEALPGVKAVLTQAKLAGRVAKIVDEAHGTAMDFKAFADTKVTYQGEKIAAVAAVSREIAEEAVRLIEVEYELLPAVVDPREAVRPGAPIIHEGLKPCPGPDGTPLVNVLRVVDRVEGDVEDAFARSDYRSEEHTS